MATEAPPPSYATVVADTNSRLTANPTDIHHVLNVMASIPANEKQLLIDHTTTNPPTLTDDQKSKFGQGMIDAMNSAAGSEFIKSSATNATNAINAIELMFQNLLSELSTIDSKYPDIKPGFVPGLQVIQDVCYPAYVINHSSVANSLSFLKKFRSTVYDSRTLAVEIAAYGERFESIILKIVQAPQVPVNIKQDKVNEFIKDAEAFEKSSKDINSRYVSLYDELIVFTGKFATFADKQEKTIDEDLVKLRKDLVDLNNEIRDKRIAMIVLGGIAVAALPITGIIAICAGPAAPAVIVGGLIIAGVTAVTAVALAFAISSLQNDVRLKEKQITQKEADKQDIQNTRAKLEMLGKQDLEIFKSNIDVLGSFWRAAITDAHSIQTALEGAKKDMPLQNLMPDIVLISINKSTNIYKLMSRYLTEYAKGIDHSTIPKPAPAA